MPSTVSPSTTAVCRPSVRRVSIHEPEPGVVSSSVYSLAWSCDESVMLRLTEPM